MKSLRLKVALWFACSVVAVLGVFVGVTHLHLRHELRVEKWERANREHQNWTLHGSYSEAEVDDIVQELGHLALIYALPVALLSLAIGYFLARRSFAPVAALNSQLQAIGAQSLKQRVSLNNADREFEAIQANINALLGRLENSFSQLTEFSGQVAHELRTPLTLLRLKVEDAAGRIEPELAESLQEELGRLTDYIDQCLLLATAEQGRLIVKTESIQLRSFLEDLLETYRLWAGQQNRTVSFIASEEISAICDPRYLRHICHNLLANAVKHGTGPIQVTLTKKDTTIICRIENQVTTASNESSGTRLGLRIVHALAPHLKCHVSTRIHAGIHIAEIQWQQTL